MAKLLHIFYHKEGTFSLLCQQVHKFTLSRVFSGIFHKNFKQYINEHRLNYASAMLECSNEDITSIYLDAGFESQRTFNRVFKDRFRMTPREYRKRFRE